MVDRSSAEVVTVAIVKAASVKALRSSESQLVINWIMERCPFATSMPTKTAFGPMAQWATVFVCLAISSIAAAQDATAPPPVAPKDAAKTAPSDPKISDPKTGILIDLPLPLTGRSVDAATQTLEAVASSGQAAAGQASRTTVVVRYLTDENDGKLTEFEEALRFARAMARPEFRNLRIVAYVNGDVKGHAVLPVLASDVLVIGDAATLSDAAVNEPDGKADDTILASYQAIAARRGLFPPPVVEALVRPGQELVLATTLDGKRRFAAGEEVATLRREGGGWQEEVWSASGQSLQLTAPMMRTSRIATHFVSSFDEVPTALDLAELKSIAESLLDGGVSAGLLEVAGAISRDRVRRWELNLAKATDAGEVNAVVVSIDSAGGSLESSLRFAGTLSSTVPPLRRAFGFVQAQARADASLVAVACKPLYLHPESRLGGPGGQAINGNDLRPITEAIDQIATDAGRPSALIRGLLDPDLKVYRYTNNKTGQIRYATEDEFALGSDVPEDERRLWRRGELITLADGLTANQAIELGLAEGQVSSVDELAIAVGLEQTPVPIVDRGLVHFVEWIGGMKGVSVLLLMVGMIALSMEAGAPGISIPGFVAMLAFAAYFWIQFLNGTAQWLEIMLFVLGLACIAIELFIVPGVGVFGIGGLCLLVLGVVLTSQTFVIPRNTYQFEQLTRSLWLVVGGFGAMVLGFTLLRIFMPRQMIFKHLALETPDDEMIERAERLADYEYLLGESGVATTPLRPSGKAKFGNEFVQVISDGTPLSTGDAVRVIEVKGNRIVVAPLE